MTFDWVTPEVGKEYSVYVASDREWVRAEYKYQPKEYDVVLYIFNILEGRHKGVNIIVPFDHVKALEGE